MSLGAAEGNWGSIPWGPLGDEADIAHNRPSETRPPINSPALADSGRLSGVNFPALPGRPAQAGGPRGPSVGDSREGAHSIP